MSSVFSIPEVLALALSLAAAPPVPAKADDASLAEAPAIHSALQTFKASHSAHWRQLRNSEASWLQIVDAGRRLPRYRKISQRVFKTMSGRYYVPVASERQEIMALRRNLDVAFTLTVNSAIGNAEYLTEKLARRPLAAELYLAHRLGSAAAATIIRLAETAPRKAPAALYPKLAFDNIKLFFSAKKPRSAKALYRLAAEAFGRAARRALTPLREVQAAHALASWQGELAPPPVTWGERAGSGPSPMALAWTATVRRR